MERNAGASVLNVVIIIIIRINIIIVIIAYPVIKASFESLLSYRTII